MKAEAFKRYEVFADEATRERLKELWRASQQPLFGPTTAAFKAVCESVDRAIADYYALVDKVAVDGGLPEPPKDEDGDVVHYGIDFSNGQILGVP